MEVAIPEFQQRLQALFFNKEVFKFIAHETRNSVQSWYRSLPEDWFDNPKPFPDGTPRHGGTRTFMYPLGTSWEYKIGEDNSFSLEFKHGRADGSPWGLRLQQFGGEITPKNKRALTLPVTAEARGMTAYTFQQKYGRKLFAVGKEEGAKLGTLVWEDAAGQLHAAYALRKRSYVPPLKKRRGHDALPTEQQVQEWAAKHYTNFLKYQDLF